MNRFLLTATRPLLPASNISTKAATFVLYQSVAAFVTRNYAQVVSVGNKQRPPQQQASPKRYIISTSYKNKDSNAVAEKQQYKQKKAVQQPDDVALDKEEDELLKEYASSSTSQEFSIDDFFKITEKERRTALEKVLSGSQSLPPELLVVRDSEEDETNEGLIKKDKTERLQKFLARMGLCSRRYAEEFILYGRVEVDDKIIFELGTSVIPGISKVVFDGVEVTAPELQEKLNRPKLYAFRKTRGVVCSRVDKYGRPTIYQKLATLGLGHLMPIGRLDYNAEGLLLLTNDGNLKQYMEMPSSHMSREYLVRVRGDVDDDTLAKIRKTPGVEADQYKTRSAGHSWIRVRLNVNKIDVIEIMERLRLRVSRMIRVRYGPYKLTERVPKNSCMSLVIPEPLLEHCNVHHQAAEKSRKEKAEQERLAAVDEEIAKEKLIATRTKTPLAKRLSTRAAGTVGKAQKSSSSRAMQKSQY